MIDEGKAVDGGSGPAADGMPVDGSEPQLEHFVIPSQLQQRHLEVQSCHSATDRE